MNDLENQLRRIVNDLQDLNQRFALVGGLAVSVRAEPRLTRDTDLAVAVGDDAEAERLIHQLQQRGYQVIASVEQQNAGRLATIRLAFESADGIVTDLLFASSGIEAEIVSGADELTVVPGLSLPVASVGHLMAMKILARDDRHRPMDADDLRALRSIASDDDWVVAKLAAELIESRGYARNRDLRAAMEQLRESGAY